MIIFDPNIPETESRIQSEPIRRNFNALNDVSNQLTPTPDTDVGSTSVVIGAADKVYFEDNLYIPFSGEKFDLGALITGVSTFSTAGTFKEIIVFFKAVEVSPGEFEGQLGFIEGLQANTSNHTVDTAASIINNIANQFIPDPSTGAQVSADDGFGNSPIDDSIIICSVLVTNDGQTGIRGAINPVLEADLIDIRPVVQRTVNTQALTDHIAAPTLAQAHPGSVITNSIINSTSTLATSTVAATNILPVASTAAFDPGTLGFDPIVRITPDIVLTAGSTFITAKVTGISGSSLVLDHEVSVSSGSQVIRGEITLDKMVFDLVQELEPVLERDFTTGGVQLTSATTGAIPLSGDVSGTSSVNVVDTVGGKTAAEITTVVDLTSDINSNTTHRGTTTGNPHSVVATEISDFDTEVGNNTDVSANTTHRSSDGTDHADVVSNNSHRINTSNPHSVTAAQAGAAPTSHNHSASDITSGTLPVNRGGTGATTAVNARETLGIFAGSATLSSGSVNINVSGQFDPTAAFITVTARTTQAAAAQAPIVTGTRTGTTFDIDSEDGTDTRIVDWIAII